MRCFILGLSLLLIGCKNDARNLETYFEVPQKEIELRVEEADIIVQAYREYLIGAGINFEKAELELKYAELQLGALKQNPHAFPEHTIRDAELKYELCKLRVKEERQNIRESEIDLQLAEVRKQLAVLGIVPMNINLNNIRIKR